MQEIKKQIIEKAKEFLKTRRTSYNRVFKNELVSKDCELVLKDLAKFCRANKSTFHDDPRIHAALEGRREVFLRIANHLNMSEEELWKLYGEK